ncbi:MAG: type II secretion system protein GspM [Coriobacteriia bacterium]|nr:type II secretion system protein GspM [Coriobacteriia bacterium]
MTRKAILNRAFAPREKALILALVVVLVGAFYYFAVVQNTANMVASSQDRISELEMQISTEQTIAMKRAAMERELEKINGQEDAPRIPVYNNFRGEWDQVKRLLADATSFQLSFGDPVASGDLVRRPAQVTFTTTTYEKALNLVRKFQHEDFRCTVNDFGMSMVSDRVSDKTGISVTLNMTFYETLNGATDLSGLTFADEEKK